MAAAVPRRLDLSDLCNSALELMGNESPAPKTPGLAFRINQEFEKIRSENTRLELELAQVRKDLDAERAARAVVIREEIDAMKASLADMEKKNAKFAKLAALIWGGSDERVPTPSVAEARGSANKRSAEAEEESFSFEEAPLQPQTPTMRKAAEKATASFPKKKLAKTQETPTIRSKVTKAVPTENSESIAELIRKIFEDNPGTSYKNKELKGLLEEEIGKEVNHSLITYYCKKLRNDNVLEQTGSHASSRWALKA